MEYGLLGSSVRGISQAVMLEWVTISFSRRSFQVRDRTCISCFGKQILVPQATRETSPVLYLKWISYRQHIVDSWLFIPFANFCLVITVFELLIFKVIVFCLFLFLVCVFFACLFGCATHMACGILVPQAGIEPCPLNLCTLQYKHGFPTCGLPGSPKSNY